VLLPDAARGSRTESGAFHSHFRAGIEVYSPACQHAAFRAARIIPLQTLLRPEKIFFVCRSSWPPEFSGAASRMLH